MPERAESVGRVSGAEPAGGAAGRGQAEDRSRNHERWAEVLAGLWRRTRDSLDGVVPEPWEPPADLGPIPAELEPRVVALRESQSLAVAQLQRRAADVSSRLRALRMIPQPPTDVPVFVDRVG